MLDNTPAEGMVIDFDELKEAWAPIDATLDHHFLNEIMDVPTAERIASWIAGRLGDRIAGLLSVRVWETPTSYATWWADDDA